MLLELTPAETAFLTAPFAALDGLPERLTRKLAATAGAGDFTIGCGADRLAGAAGLAT